MNKIVFFDCYSDFHCLHFWFTYLHKNSKMYLLYILIINCRTVSEARSYDETTIHPPTKSLRSNYDKNNEVLFIIFY